MFIIIMTLVSAGVCQDPYVEDLKRPLKEMGESCGYESCPPTKEGMLNVHIVPHTHMEVGYMNTFNGYYDGYDDVYSKSYVHSKRILDYTITELWSREDRMFTLSDTPYFFHWWSNRDATVRRMVYQLIRQGRLHIVGGGWGMVDETSTSYHGIIDQYTYSFRKINATLGPCARPLVAWQADSFGHSRTFAALASMLGFDGLFINPISFEDDLRRSRVSELEMVWRGNDDLGYVSDIFTHKLFDGYWAPPGFCFGTGCRDPLLITSDTQFNNIDERVEAFLQLVRFRQAPHYVTNHIMVMMGERFGYYDASMWFENIDKLIFKVNEKSYNTSAKIHLKYSTPACYLKDVYESSPQLPVKQDDFLPVAYDRQNYFSGLFTSRPTVKFMAREGHIYLQMTKQLQVLARLWNNDKTFEELNWIMGIIQDHNVLSGGMRSFVKDHYTFRMYHAVQRSTLLLKQAFNKLRRSPEGTIYYRCAFNVSSCRNTNALRSFVVVYNPLAWHATIPVRLPALRSKYTVYDPKLKIVESVMMKIPDSVLRIPTRNTVADHEIVFLAENLPPMGYRSYYIESTYMDIKKRRSIIKKPQRFKSRKFLARPAQLANFESISLLEGTNDSVVANIEQTGSPPVTTEYETTHPDENEMESSEELEPMDKTYLPPARWRKVHQEGHVDSAFQQTTNKNDETINKIDDEDVVQMSDYFYNVSDDNFIGNKYITVKFDDKNRVSRVNLSNGVEMALKIQMLYYMSDDPIKLGRPNDTQPGPNIFKPMDFRPILIKEHYECHVHKSPLVQEAHYSFAHWADYSIRVYEDKPLVELDWVVGPIPIHDDIGKDVFIRYSTDLQNGGYFFTDSNGRQTVRRLRNYKPSYEPVYADAIPGNYYPVTSKIYIEDIDKNIRFSIFNDRGQGGASLNDGQIDLMVHRRILTDEGGVQCILNDTEKGYGIVVRGKHYLYISKANYKLNKVFEKKFAKEIELSPQVLVSPNNAHAEYTKEIWERHVNEFTGVTKKLPVGVHILTLQEWNDKTLLLRLENYLEKADVPHSGVRTVFVKNLFTNLTIIGLEETTLGANVWLRDYTPLRWTTKDSFASNFNDYYAGNTTKSNEENVKFYEVTDIEKGIRLLPQQIRTFVVTFKYN